MEFHSELGLWLEDADEGRNVKSTMGSGSCRSSVWIVMGIDMAWWWCSPCMELELYELVVVCLCGS